MDKEYWLAVLKGLTPFEASQLGEAICEAWAAGQVEAFPILPPDVIADTIPFDDMVMLIEQLAMRQDVVNALEKVECRDWCIDGKHAVSVLRRKRQQLFLFVEQEGKREVSNG
jgi:hypothetical protein